MIYPTMSSLPVVPSEVAEIVGGSLTPEFLGHFENFLGYQLEMHQKRHSFWLKHKLCPSNPPFFLNHMFSLLNFHLKYHWFGSITRKNHHSPCFCKAQSPSDSSHIRCFKPSMVFPLDPFRVSGDSAGRHRRSAGSPASPWENCWENAELNDFIKCRKMIW